MATYDAGILAALNVTAICSCSLFVLASSRCCETAVRGKPGLATLFAVLGRCVVAVLCTMCYKSPWSSGPVDSLGSFAVRVVEGTAIWQIALSPFVFPCPLVAHVPLQAAIVTTLVDSRGMAVCRAVVSTRAGRQTVVEAWRLLSKISWAILSSVYLLGDVQEATDPGAVPACDQTMSWSLAMLGFVVPTCMIWVGVGSHSRGGVGCTANHKVPRQKAGPTARELTMPDLFGCVMLTLLTTALLWEVLADYFIGRGARCVVVNGQYSGLCEEVQEAMRAAGD